MARAWDVMLAAALAHAGVEEGVACVGTPVESRTIKANGRAFLFLSPKKAYFKLGASLEEAKRVALSSAAVVPGGGGWTSLLWDAPCPVGEEVLRRWVDESHGLMVAVKSVGAAPTVGLLPKGPKRSGAKVEGGKGRSDPKARR